jgi:hypothetical protein
MLNKWDSKILRMMYGSVTKQGVLIIRTNLTPKELYKTPDLVKGKIVTVLN